MFTFITALFNQSSSLMLITLVTLGLIGFVLQRIVSIWQQLPLQEDLEFDEAFWKEL